LIILWNFKSMDSKHEKLRVPEGFLNAFYL